MCIFCKIINRQIPSSIVYENDYVLAFLDNTQATPGHTLIVPKKHFANFFELDELYATEIIKAAKIVAQKLQDNFHCEGLNLLNNNNVAGGQSVFHYHMHVIPRYANDPVNLALPQHEITNEQLNKTLNELCK